MKRAIRDQLVADLKSGRFKKGAGRLRDSDDEFCCLGVLCERAVAAGVISPPVLRPDAVRQRGSYRYADDTTWAPPEVREWAGLSYVDQRALAAFNDISVNFLPVIIRLKGMDVTD